MPELNFEGTSEGLLNLILVSKVDWQQDRLSDAQRQHVDLLHEVGLQCFSLVLRVKSNELGLVVLTQELELEVKQGGER